MEPRGKPRSAGRSRGPSSGNNRPGPYTPGGGRSTPRPPQPGQHPPGAGPSIRPLAQPSGSQPHQQEQMGGRGSRHGGDDEHVSPAVTDPTRVVQGGGDAGVEARRGAGGGNGGSVRGRVNRNEVLHTKPQQVHDKRGSRGQPVNLTANYFELLQAGKWCLNQYRVDFAPDIDSTPARKGFMRTAMADVIKGGYLFDGTVMYTPLLLDVNPLELMVLGKEGEKIQIIVRLVGTVAWGDHHYIQLFNLIIRKCLAYLKFKLMGRNYFDPMAKIAVPEYRLELWPGYYTSMRQHERSILLNADVQHKVTHMTNAYDVLLEFQRGGSNVRNEYQSRMIGTIVLTGYNNRTYRVDDIDFNATPLSTFTMKDGTEMSYVQYFKEKYNLNCRDTSQPMLISRSKAREIRAGMPETVYLVPEFCTLTGLTDRQRENFKLMSELAKHTRVNPDIRVRKLNDFISRMRNCKEVVEEIKRWDLTLANHLVTFKGRILPEEKIMLGANHSVDPGPKSDWTNGLRSSAMFSSATIGRMAVICPRFLRDSCNNFLDLMNRCAGGFKWSLGNIKVFEIPDDRTNSFLDCLQNVTTMGPSLIICILKNVAADRYSAIKKKCAVETGIPTQVITQRSLNNKNAMSIATKVVIQLNCKLGGAPWAVKLPLTGLMIVGYDVCRDTFNKNKSFGAYVASMNPTATRYFNFVKEHTVAEELSDNFANFLITACHKYKEVNGSFPERILIYRDGVGDGQLTFVYEHEVVQIKKRLTEEIYTSNDLKMAFVVVTKRINTRLFYQNQNPPPGTVADDVITLPERYDFFLVSQCVKQGSVAPTSYNVIEDTMGLIPDRMQTLTYKLTHMYYNWAGTVRVPAPCQYAHKLATLVSQSLHRPAHNRLENVLHYL